MGNNTVKNVILGVLAVGLVGMTIAYAALSQTLTINSTATVKAANWNIHFENLNGGVKTTTAELAPTANQMKIVGTTNIQGSVGIFKQPGDYAEYTFEVVNGGSIDAILNTYTIGNPQCTSTASTDGSKTAEQNAALVCNNLTYTLQYSDTENGSYANPAKGDALTAGTKKYAKLTVTYTTNGTEVSSQPVEIDDLDAQFDYIQASNYVAN